MHTVRQWLRRNAAATDKVLLKVDFENAFNNVDRHAFLSQCRQHFPGLAPGAEWCYLEPTNLLFGSYVVASESGVQQGDP